MIQTEKLVGAPAPQSIQLSTRAKVFWTFGNALMLVGLVLLLYVGGLYAEAEYGQYAARGDTDVPAPEAVSEPSITSSDEPPPFVAPTALVEAEPAPFTAPVLNSESEEGRVVSAIPAQPQADHHSTVSRVIIPSIDVDTKVVEVGWDVKKQGGKEVAVWKVAEYAVGQHRGSANPGEAGNVVLAGHVGGYGKVFKELYYVKPGDQVVIYSAGQQYLYTVQERLLVTEEGVPPEQQAANAQYIAPTDHEVVTMVTCWPLTGRNKFTQRVIVRAVPFGSASENTSLNNWTIR